jgi:hypothetical protein
MNVERKLMEGIMSQPIGSSSEMATLINDLQTTYVEYMRSLKKVVDQGQKIVPALTEALSQKHANAIAKALGILFCTGVGSTAIPSLVEWVLVQSPMYPEVLEALARAGDHALPHVLSRMEKCIKERDDEGLRNLLDVASKLRTPQVQAVVDLAVRCLKESDPCIRETAADSIAWFSPKYTREAANKLILVAEHDQASLVREAAKQSLAEMGQMG